MNNWCLLVFHAYINEMHGSRGKIPSKKSRQQRCADGFNLDVKALIKGRDSSVGIATHYRLAGQGIESPWGARFSAPIQIGPAAHPPS
jgi:hypothetical protein